MIEQSKAVTEQLQSKYRAKISKYIVAAEHIQSSTEKYRAVQTNTEEYREIHGRYRANTDTVTDTATDTELHVSDKIQVSGTVHISATEQSTTSAE